MAQGDPHSSAVFTAGHTWETIRDVLELSMSSTDRGIDHVDVDELFLWPRFVEDPALEGDMGARGIMVWEECTKVDLGRKELIPEQKHQMYPYTCPPQRRVGTAKVVTR